MKQLRWKSKVAWTTLVAELVIIGGLFFADEVTLAIKIIGMAVIAIVAGFGWFNDPTSKGKF